MALDFLYLNASEKYLDAFSDFLPENFIKDHPDNFVYGALLKEKYPVGVIAYVPIGHEIEITYLYVHPQARRKKIGSQLIDYILDVPKKDGLFYPVSLRFIESESFGMYEFLTQYPRMNLQFSHNVYTLTFDEINSQDRLNLKKSIEAKSFFEYPKAMQNSLLLSL